MYVLSCDVLTCVGLGKVIKMVMVVKSYGVITPVTSEEIMVGVVTWFFLCGCGYTDVVTWVWYVGLSCMGLANCCACVCGVCWYVCVVCAGMCVCGV